MESPANPGQFRPGVDIALEGTGAGPAAFWLSAPACVAAAGRLGGEPQAHLPPVLRSGAVGTDQTASEAGGGDPGSGTGTKCPGAMLEHGFCDGPVAGWAGVSGPDRGG